ncbi:hypothetical protein DFH07DRAFT_464672 [Mycena maculata]|uniref:F-box domain-containing protein n=1 Tax=Mycena maculata TaxID=230809 RepID=A0AAD7KA30_9AGAR|nr:hypothetical protein DFH07DRAFT_464672 [Mycena maculata]
MSFLEALPGEVLLLIVSFLEVPEIHILRQTCCKISQVTRDKSVWLEFLEYLRRRGDTPLPPIACDPAVPAIDLSSSSLESIGVSATRASDSWLLPREPTCIMPPNGEVVAGLNVFLDTWLLIVYLSGHVYLWNIRENVPRQRAALDLRAPGVGWSSYSAYMAHRDKVIMLAMSNTAQSGTCNTVLYKIDARETDIGFDLVGSFSCDYPRTIRAIDVEHRLLVLTSVSTLDMVCWDPQDNNTSRISLNDDEELFNGVVAVSRLGSHFLVIRTHTIELHSCGDATKREPRTPPKHWLPFPLREGAVSVSDALTTQTPDSQEAHNVCLLAYDSHSLTIYTVTITMFAGEPPTMEVTLAGQMRPAPPQVQSRGPPFRLTRSHWFVSTHALGPQAIRAMWIERDSLTMTRQVRLCTFNRNAAWHEMKTAASVFTLASYDLREDLTQCALAEVSGRIVLGNRAGAVFLLAPTRPLERAAQSELH